MVFTIDEIKELLYPVFQSYGIRSALIFGSYTSGKATVKSDVDLCVDSGLKGLQFVGFLDDVKKTLNGKNVDLLDITHIIPDSKVDHEIRKTGVQIYAQ